MSATGILQSDTVISLTTQTLIGYEIPTENSEYINLFLDYTKGDETGVTIRMFTRRVSGDTAHQSRVWAEVSGVNTASLETIPLTVSGRYMFSWLLGAIDFVYFTQAGTNDGTPTGTLKAAFTLL